MSTKATKISASSAYATHLVQRSTRADWRTARVYDGTCVICRTPIPDGARGFTLKKTNLSCCQTHWPKDDLWPPTRASMNTRRRRPDLWPEAHFRRKGVDTYIPNRGEVSSSVSSPRCRAHKQTLSISQPTRFIPSRGTDARTGCTPALQVNGGPSSFGPSPHSSPRLTEMPQYVMEDADAFLETLRDDFSLAAGNEELALVSEIPGQSNEAEIFDATTAS